MRAHEFLVEYKSEAAIKAILNKYGNKIQDKLAQDLQIAQNKQYENLTPGSLLDLIIQVDPTKNSQYTDWILRQYLSNQFRYIEDIGKATSLLSFYEKAKPKLPQEARDINKFKTFDQFYDYIDELKNKKVDTTSNREKERQFEQELISNKEVEIFYNSPDIKIVIPRTERASCYFGRNTRWCTAAEDAENNMFDYYSQDGDLYILLFKKTNTRWQFHFESGQFMDEKDKALSPAEVKSVAKLFPGTWIYPDFNDKEAERKRITMVDYRPAAIRYMSNPSTDVQLQAVKRDPYAIKYIDRPSEQIQAYAVEQDGLVISEIDDPSDYVKMLAVKQDGRAIRYIRNSNEDLEIAAVKEYWGVISDIYEPSERVQLEAIRQSDGDAIIRLQNRTVNAEVLAVEMNPSLIGIIKNPSLEAQIAAVREDGEMLDYIVNPSDKVRQEAEKTLRRQGKL